jgi:hypothetical protein
MSPLQEKSCSRCGVKFGCGVENDSCWCQQLPAVSIDDPNVDCLCPDCIRVKVDQSSAAKKNCGLNLIAGEDYYLEGERMVFTSSYHLRRGHCCESGCRHCPYGASGQDLRGELSK